MDRSGDFEAQRRDLAARLQRRENLSEPVTRAMETVPREEFLSGSQRSRAYADRPLPIGKGQTVSAPHMVAIMTEKLDISQGDDVLEIGTGCGYHAAVTAEVVGTDHVYSVEYVRSLAEEAGERLDRLGYGDIAIRHGNGREGWPAHQPYDATYLTCATSDLPAALVDQLRVGGTLLAPVGDRSQWLVRGVKQPDGSLNRERLSRVRFVPMQGEG